MTHDPVVWHYGLMAERWAECINEAPQIPFYLQKIARFGQPVLDLACGTGRLLLPLLQAGIDVDGCDLSPDMLAHCRQKASDAGLTPSLYEQPMHALDLPREYRTILINELVLMLKMAGFSEITVHGDFGSEPATADHKELVFTAIK